MPCCVWKKPRDQRVREYGHHHGVKRVPSTISIFGPEILYPEQYQIADLDCVLNIDKSYNLLGWQPVYNDQDMILDAYDYFVNSI